jgi:hypothetical protein
MGTASALSRLRIGVLGNGWHTQSLRWVWFFLRISHALRKASERATQKSNLDKALGEIGSLNVAEGTSRWGISGDVQSFAGQGWFGCGTTHTIQGTHPSPTIDSGSTGLGGSSRANATNFGESIVVAWQENGVKFCDF